jgi:hypothetical protein
MSRSKTRSKLGATAVGVGLFLVTAHAATSAPPVSQADRGAGEENPRTTTKYDNTNSQPERFEGKVVCVSPDGKQKSTGPALCEDGSKVLALSIAESDVIHPIVAPDDTLRDKLVSHVGETVVIEGKRYEASGMIMASTVLSERAVK